MKKNLLYSAILFSSAVFGQVPEITWQDCYGTGDDDIAWTICNTASGYLLGLEIHDGDGLPNYHGSYEILVVAIDTAGAITWQKCFGGQARDIPNKIIDAGNDEYFIYGKTKSVDGDVQSGNYGTYDLWVVKINQLGDILWEKNFGSIWYDSPKDIVPIGDGGFVLLSEIQGGGGDVSVFYGDVDIWLCKCDAGGQIEWEKTFGNEGKDKCQGLTINAQGNILLAGSVEEPGGNIDCGLKGESDIWVAEIDLEGNLLWQRCFGGSHDDFGYGIMELNDGHIILGSTRSNDGDVSGNHGSYLYGDDIWATRVDIDGNLIWQRCLGGSNLETPSFLAQTDDGGFLVFGDAVSDDGDVTGNHYIGESTSDIWVVKLTPEGSVEWQRCYGGASNENLKPHGTIKNENGNYVIAATSYIGSSGDISCFLDGKGAWVFNIVKCPGYAPGIPEIPLGPDTVYSPKDLENVYTIMPPANSWTFDWKLEPGNAGVVTESGLHATILWNAAFSGSTAVYARSANYCGESQWSQPLLVQVYDYLGIGGSKDIKLQMKVYPNPARAFVVFELPIEAISDNPKNKPVVISTPGAGHGAGRSLPAGKAGNPLTDLGPAGKPQGKGDGLNSKGIPPYGRNDNGGGITVVVVDVFGQQVAELQGNGTRTVWNTNDMEAGVYFYKAEINGKVISGKVVIQK